MAGNLQTNDIVVEDLVPRVLSGKIRIPTFQRGLRWTERDVLRLFESIAKGYPIGNLLLWNKAAPAQTVHLGALTMHADPEQSAWYVVDGQQRITALANGLTENGHSDPRFRIFYDVNTETFTNKESRSGTTIPLYVIFDLPQLLDLFTSSPILLGNRDFIDRASNLSKIIRGFRIPIYIVEEENPAVLRDIFDRMNNFGRQLTRAEVFSALNEETGVETEESRPFRYDQISEAVQAATRFGTIDDDTVFLCLLARRGADISRDIRREFSNASDSAIATEPRALEFKAETRSEAWALTTKAMISAVQFLMNECKIPHYSFLPYRYLLITLVRFFAHFPNPTAADLRDLRRWVWRSAVIGPSHFKGSVTGTTRILCSKIEPHHERKSIENLLGTAPATEVINHVPTTQETFKTNHAASKIIMCSLWHRSPARFEDAVNNLETVGHVYSRDLLQEELADSITARDFFPMIYATNGGEPTTNEWKSLKRSAGNRILFNTPTATASPYDAIYTLVANPVDDAKVQETLASHIIDQECQEFIVHGDPKSFIAHRNKLLQSQIHDFVELMTEQKFEDTPPLSSFDFDDSDDFDDEDEDEGRDRESEKEVFLFDFNTNED
ncbi:DUF262 domain-containing protein [Kocuria sp. cx-455]|uniref:DUF262 domain-containing protein n=1 Tax=Kocuria sp. cx-455 TaxID=2771377 RepID=UPI003D720EA7